jgi:hypothetical protein
MGYCDIKAIEECLAEHHERIAAVIMECLHGAVKYALESIIALPSDLTSDRTSTEIQYSRGRINPLAHNTKIFD